MDYLLVFDNTFVLHKVTFFLLLHIIVLLSVNKKENNPELTFEIKLPLFEGPFDLLLFFIQRDELDIYDIPISEITNDFLDYLKQLEKLNIDVASEFILVAATLMRIKARMLLPRPVLDEEGNEIDPREELIRHLLEYKRFKAVVGPLSELEERRLEMEPRGNVLKEVKKLSESGNVESELQDVDLYKLLKVYAKVIDRYKTEQNKPVHQVIQYPFTIAKQKQRLMAALTKKGRLSFEEIVQEIPTKIAAIFNFLAILEMIQLQTISINVGLGFNNFWIESREAVTEG